MGLMAYFFMGNARFISSTVVNNAQQAEAQVVPCNAAVTATWRGARLSEPLGNIFFLTWNPQDSIGNNFVAPILCFDILPRGSFWTMWLGGSRTSIDISMTSRQVWAMSLPRSVVAAGKRSRQDSTNMIQAVQQPVKQTSAL